MAAVWICLPLAILISFGKRWCGLLAVTLAGAAAASLIAVPSTYPGDTAANRMIGRLAKAPEWRGLGVYIDLQLESIDAHPYLGKARLTEFLDNPEQRSLFEALDLG